MGLNYIVVSIQQIKKTVLQTTNADLFFRTYYFTSFYDCNFISPFHLHFPKSHPFPDTQLKIHVLFLSPSFKSLELYVNYYSC